jgi:hypothetical protein
VHIVGQFPVTHLYKHIAHRPDYMTFISGSVLTPSHSFFRSVPAFRKSILLPYLVVPPTRLQSGFSTLQTSSVNMYVCLNKPPPATEMNLCCLPNSTFFVCVGSTDSSDEVLSYFRTYNPFSSSILQHHTCCDGNVFCEAAFVRMVHLKNILHL